MSGMDARSRRTTWGLVALALLGVGAIWALQDRVDISPPQEILEDLESEPEVTSEVFSLITLSEEEKLSKLEVIAETGNGLDPYRARYLLAVNAIDANQPETALDYLNELEQEYEVLQDQILLKRAEAYDLKDESEQAREIWSNLIARDSSVAAEAMYHLGAYDSQHWDDLISEFPYHPHSHEIILQRLEENPEQPLALLRTLLYHAPEGEERAKGRDRAVEEYEEQLTPEDWEVIAEGYWDTWEYQKAAEAYANAPETPRNMYRHARGLQVSGETESAKDIYQQLSSRFPEAEETGLGLRNLASMVSREEALSYLEEVINEFPKQAPNALISKANLLEAAGESQAAQEARQILLEDYSDSNQVAEYRWEMAEEEADEGNLSEAINWGEAITRENPSHSNAPKASFWVGKWLQQQGDMEAANTAWEDTLSQFPTSYYAWRSAVHLGLPVGDFSNVRNLEPEVIKPNSRARLPAGSDAFKELYQLGQDEVAWRLWQGEIGNQSSLSIAEQFTKGALQQRQGEYLQGINQITSLRDRDDEKDLEKWQSLREEEIYWHYLFPFPYNDSIIQWSEEREVNPLLTISLIRQESRFEKDIGSVVGARGLMQLMPTTGEWVAEQINLNDYSLTDPDQNIQLGTWYLAFTHRQHNNNSMLAMASYNAGSGNVTNWIDRFGLEDEDEFVRQIPFPETKGYVEAVFSNYWNYLRLYNPEIRELMEE
ncbi:lytic transglycosylase domain-containing protein [Euhalothece natronophila]|nr:transglycosylase SLT domain-containing protein [Euhalothece natronophila]